MNTNMTGSRSPAAWIVGLLVLLEAATFIVAGLLHLGVPLPVGFSEPRNVPAFVVETLIGFFFAISAFALFARKRWSWGITLGAHVVCIAGVLLGIAATTFGPGATTAANALYHCISLAVAVVVTIWLLTPGAQDVLGRGQKRQETPL